MSRGDYTHADRITDNSLAAIERRHSEMEAFLERLRAIDADQLAPEDLLNSELFEFLLTGSVEGHRFRMFLAPVGGRFGPHQRIPQMAERVRFKRYEDYVNYLKRL